MKRFTQILMLLFVGLFVTFMSLNEIKAQEVQHGPGFVDANGDGFNDNAPDSDGDGIPNGQDPDWTKPADGTGMQAGKNNRFGGKQNGTGFIDEDGDGICDNFQDADGDGIPNGEDPDWVRPQDGTGKQLGKMKNGSGQRGTGRIGNGQRFGNGVCDGTGPKGKVAGKQAQSTK